MLHNDPILKIPQKKELSVTYAINIVAAASFQTIICYPLVSMGWQFKHSDYQPNPQYSFWTNLKNAVHAAVTNPETKKRTLYFNFGDRFPGLMLDRIYTFGGQALLANKLQLFFGEDKIKSNGMSAIFIGLGHNYLSPFFKYDSEASSPATFLKTIRKPVGLFALFTVPSSIQSKLKNPTKKEKITTQFLGAIASVLITSPIDNISKEQKPTSIFKNNPSRLFEGASKRILMQAAPLSFFLLVRDYFNSLTKEEEIQYKNRRHSF